jgi:hypothetical protein
MWTLACSFSHQCSSQSSLATVCNHVAATCHGPAQTPNHNSGGSRKWRSPFVNVQVIWPVGQVFRPFRDEDLSVGRSVSQVFTFGSELRKVPLIAVAPTG